MNEGTNAILVLDDKRYEVKSYKVIDDLNLCHTIELTFSNPPELLSDESYIAHLETNGDAIWFFPWLVFKDTLPKITASVYGGIFCPFGLSAEEKEKYTALNLIIVSDLCYDMTYDVWKNFLLVVSDWLKSKSIPQYKDYISLANQLDEDEDEKDDENEESSSSSSEDTD